MTALRVLGVECARTLPRQYVGRLAQFHVHAADDGLTAGMRWSVWLRDHATLAIGFGASLAEAEADAERDFAATSERYAFARGALDAAKGGAR